MVSSSYLKSTCESYTKMVLLWPQHLATAVTKGTPPRASGSPVWTPELGGAITPQAGLPLPNTAPASPAQPFGRDLCGHRRKANPICLQNIKVCVEFAVPLGLEKSLGSNLRQEKTQQRAK